MKDIFIPMEKEEELIKVTSVLDFSKLCNNKVKVGEPTVIVKNSDNSNVAIKKKKRKRENVSEEDTKLEMHQSNEPYRNTYDETKTLLKSTIGQLDGLQSDISGDLSLLRNSKTIKGKYNNISLLMSTSSSLISNKLSAIKEMNKIITDSHNLELKRNKDTKALESNKDDDKGIMDLYNAFINTNPGSGSGYTMPNASNVTLLNNSSSSYGIGSSGYDDYLSDITPTKNMIMLESNKNVETVVIFDATTNNTYFDIIDNSTGNSIPNADIPDAMFLEDMTYDYTNNIARHKYLDTKYRLIVINNSNLNLY